MIGVYFYEMDKKGRVCLPAPFRKEFGESLVIVAAPRNSLILMAVRQFRRLSSEIPRDSREAQLGWNGRIQIPLHMRLYANLGPGSEMVVDGQGSYAKLWRRDAWEQATGSGQYAPTEEIVYGMKGE